MAYDPYASTSDRASRLVALTRRQFLLIMGAFAALGATVFGGIKTLGFMFPGATLEAPPEFKVPTDPATIQVGQPLQITDKRVSVVRDKDGFYAVYLICTHLGCTPNYNSAVHSDLQLSSPRSDNGWACPCHGSRYYIDSTNFYGPAPRPMDWVAVKYSPDFKSLIVDRSKIVVQRGSGDATPPKWRLDPNTHKDNGLTYP